MNRTNQISCSRPFEWFEVHPDGSVFVCCPAWLKRSVGNLLQQSLDEIWNGPLAQELRKSIHNGSFHNCSKKRCPHLLTQSPPVGPPGSIADRRVQAALTNNSSVLDYLPPQLNLCFDHSCNLACPSCRSAILQARDDDLQQAEQISEILLKELIPSAEVITLSGFGDPFGSPTYLRMLRQLDCSCHPQLRQIRLHSNGQLLSEQMWQSLPNLQQLISEVEISLDAATAATYQINRPGGDFGRLLENLQFLSRQHCELTLSMVLQQNNWRELEQLLELAENCNAKIYLSQLVNWGTFSSQEFQRRAVHLPQHPENPDFMKLLAKISKNDRVDPGNLQRWLCLVP